MNAETLRAYSLERVLLFAALFGVVDDVIKRGVVNQFFFQSINFNLNACKFWNDYS